MIRAVESAWLGLGVVMCLSAVGEVRGRPGDELVQDGEEGGGGQGAAVVGPAGGSRRECRPGHAGLGHSQQRCRRLHQHLHRLLHPPQPRQYRQVALVPAFTRSHHLPFSQTSLSIIFKNLYFILARNCLRVERGDFLLMYCIVAICV